MSKILIIEDEAAIRRVLTKILSEENESYKVEEAEDGLQGLEKVKNEDYDLILMDIGLPGIDGWTATRRIKDNPATKHIAVIALTAHAMTTDREKASESGCDDYETKPIDFTRLFEKLDSLLAGNPSSLAGL